MGVSVRTHTPIDDLTGGIEAGALVLIYGPTGCGKTTLCLKMAEGIMREGYQVVYIDTEGGAPELPGVRFIRVRDLKEQGEALKNLRKEGLSRAMIFVDSMTAAYHRRVLSVPAQLRAGVAGDLSGTISRHIDILRDIVEERGENIAVLTAHLKSPVEYHFKMNMLRKMAKAWREGKYVPTAGDYMNIFADDPVKWIGGRALGMHVHRRLRIFVDEDGSRILYIDKWPLRPNLCIRYVMDERGNIKVAGGTFTLQDQMMRKLYSLEFKTILSEALEITEKEGIEVEGVEEGGEGKGEEGPKRREEGQRRRRPKPGELRLPKVPSLGDIAEEEKARGGRADEPGDSGPDREGAGGGQG